MKLIYSPTLTHHGILGQKWGVRRYQNKDGSLTPAGQKRYTKEELLDNRDKAFKKQDEYFNKHADDVFDMDTYKKYTYDPEYDGADIKKAFEEYKKEMKSYGYKDTIKDLYSSDKDFAKLVDATQKWQSELDKLSEQEWKLKSKQLTKEQKKKGRQLTISALAAMGALSVASIIIADKVAPN